MIDFPNFSNSANVSDVVESLQKSQQLAKEPTSE